MRPFRIYMNLEDQCQEIENLLENNRHVIPSDILVALDKLFTSAKIEIHELENEIEKLENQNHELTKEITLKPDRTSGDPQ